MLSVVVERQAVAARRCALSVAGVSEVPVCGITKKRRRPQGIEVKGLPWQPLE